jgi:radical SAM superfamily enzyme YgiQ (UPF0313 family)
MNIPPNQHSFGNNVPISLLYLGAQLVKEGQEVQILLNFVSDLIVLCLFSDGYTRCYELINQIRRFSSSVKIVLGGPEVSANREEVMRIFRNKADFLLVGEAEYTLGQLANCLADQNKSNLQSIKGISYCDAGEIFHNPFPDPIKEIDNLPFPLRSLIRPEIWEKWYYRAGLGRPCDVLLTSRGCPFTCRFCYRLASQYRDRSSENVFAEIAEIYAHGTRAFIIVDDNFTINRSRCVAILDGILKKGWKFAIKCRGRVNSVDPELLRLMKRAGVRSMTFGIESGSQKMLDAMNKKTTVEQNYEAIRMVHEAGLQCYADLFIGFPGETPETIKETSDFLLRAKPTGINMGWLYPLHGTEVYEQVKQEGTLVGDWGLLEEYPWVRLPWFDNLCELKSEWRKIYRRFWLNPTVILHGLKANILHFRPHDYLDVARWIWHRYIVP